MKETVNTIALAGLLHDVGKFAERADMEMSQLYLKAPGTYRKQSEARGVAAWLLLETGAATLSELSRVTGRDIPPLSNAAKAVRSRAIDDHVLAESMAELKQSLQ